MRYNRLIEEVRPLLLSRMGGCRWALLAVAMVVVASMACHGEQDVRPLKVSGWIDGYFVSPGGDLVFRTLDVSSSPAVETDVALHPLWAGYRVRLSFAAHDDVTAIVVSALESGAVLTVKRFVRPRSWPGLLLVNDDDGDFCHSSDGLSYKLTVTYRDGGTADAIVSLDGVSLLPALQPRIDWIDLVRISEVRRWLGEAGDGLLPGLRADDVPFALMTSDDQVLLVDWPDTPAGFWHLTFRRLADEKRGGNGCLRYAMLTGSGYAPEGLSVR